MSDIKNIIDAVISSPNLFEFQEDVVRDIATRFNDKIINYTSSSPHCDVLESITGSGKTVMLVKALDAMYELKGARNINILWFSYDQELNQQTIKRFSDFSTSIGAFNVEAISSSNLQLNDNRVWFINAQKIGSGATLFKKTESMGYKNFYDKMSELPENNIKVLVIDECHNGAKTQDSILNQVIDNYCPDYIVAASATPTPFVEFFEDKRDRFTFKKVKVDNERVKESGMIKSRINLLKNEFHGYSDSLTKLVMEDYSRTCADWIDYLSRYPEEMAGKPSLSKNPAIMVQVENNFEDKITEFTDLIESIVRHSGGLISYKNIFHTFGAVGDITLTNRDSDVIKKIKASEVDDNKDLKVVVFKDNLAEGFDAPRVEILYSTRPVKSEERIIQLFGRIIRNPFMKRIEDEEYRNLMEVSFYAPNYEPNLSRHIVNSLNGDGVIITDVNEKSTNEKREIYLFKYNDEFIAKINSTEIESYQKDGETFYQKIIQESGNSQHGKLHEQVAFEIFNQMKELVSIYEFDELFIDNAKMETLDTTSTLKKESTRSYGMSDFDLLYEYKKRFRRTYMLINGDDVESSIIGNVFKDNKDSDLVKLIKLKLKNNKIKPSIQNIVVAGCMAFDEKYDLISTIEYISKEKYYSMGLGSFYNKPERFKIKNSTIKKSFLPSQVRFADSKNSALTELETDACLINRDSEVEIKIIPYLDENFNSWARNFVDSESIKIKYQHEGKNKPFNPDFYGFDTNEKFTIIETKGLGFDDHIAKLKGALRYCSENNFGLLWIIESHSKYYKLNTGRAMNEIDTITKDNLIETYCFKELVNI